MRIQSKGMLFVGFAACVVALLHVTALSLKAAPGKQSEMVVVDIEHLEQSYEAFKVENANFQRFQEERARQVAVRELLTSIEWDELGELEKKGKNIKSDEEKRLKDLLALTEARNKAIRELRSKPDMTDKDKEELKRLLEIPRANQYRLADLGEKLSAEVNGERGRLRDKLQKHVMDVYEKMSKDRGFSVVFDKGQVQWAAPAVDITKDVLDRLNRK